MARRLNHATWLARARARSEGNPNERWRTRSYCLKHGLEVPWWASTRPEVRGNPPPAVTMNEVFRAWRLAGEGRGVRVHRDGVSLLDMSGWRHYPTTEAAIAAIQEDS